MASNPRKFSEKIALHNQKQAEETAAFERIMHEVSETRGAPPRVKPPGNHLHLHPPFRSVLGGSLPNVNQISVNPQMEMQQPHHFEDSKHSIISRHPGRVDSRPRPYDPRRVPSLDRSRGMNQFENPPGRFGSSTYLPLPPENNWRSRFTLSRTNSDSALHQSVMNPNSQDHFNPTNPQINQVKKETFEVPNNSGVYHKTVMDGRTYGINRPKSCEAPTINIVRSPDQQQTITSVNPSGGAVDANHGMGNGVATQPNMSACLVPHHPAQMATNTGSLPDLTSIQFPSPLPHPLDTEDGNHMQQRHPHQMNMPQIQARPSALPPSLPPYMNSLSRPPLSPGKPRRHTHNGPSPLILDSNPEQVRRIKYPSVTSPKMCIKPELKSPPLASTANSYQYSYSSGVPLTTILSVHNSQPAAPRPMPDSRSQCNMVSQQPVFPCPTGHQPMHVDAHQQQQQHQSSSGMISPVFNSPAAPPQQQQQINRQGGPPTPQQQQQRAQQGMSSPLTSPTSPKSQQNSPASFSPVTSPQQQQPQHGGGGVDFNSSGSNPALSEPSYYPSEMTSAAALQPLQHQLEQFHVVNDNVVGSTPLSHHHHHHHHHHQPQPPMYSNVHNSLSALIESSMVDGSYDSYQDPLGHSNNSSGGGGATGGGGGKERNHYMMNTNKIPDITFTGVDEQSQFNHNHHHHPHHHRGTSGVLGAAGSCMTNDMSDYLPGEELKVNMGLEGMHLLEESSNIITDPASVVVENSFGGMVDKDF